MPLERIPVINSSIKKVIHQQLVPSSLFSPLHLGSSHTPAPEALCHILLVQMGFPDPAPLWRPFPMPLCILTPFNWEALSNLSSKTGRAGYYASLLTVCICLAVVFLQSYAAPMGKALGYICLQTYCTRLKDTDRQMSEAGGGGGRQTDRSDLQHKSFS